MKFGYEGVSRQAAAKGWMELLKDKHFHSHYFQSCYLEWEGFSILNAVLKTTVIVLIPDLD